MTRVGASTLIRVRRETASISARSGAAPSSDGDRVRLSERRCRPVRGAGQSCRFGFAKQRRRGRPSIAEVGPTSRGLGPRIGVGHGEAGEARGGVGEVCRRVALRAVSGSAQRTIERHRFAAEGGRSSPARSTGSRRATLVQGPFDRRSDAEHRESCRPQHRRRPRRFPASLGSASRFVPVPEREVDVGRSGVEHGLMPSVDGLSRGLGELAECPVGLTASGREHRPGSRQPKRDRPEACSATGGGRGPSQPRTNGRGG